ncbi:unnamed protein product [Kuraishia capsulata CBS 1993]|uniref:Conserved oligomeric Golgi complex subunit 5 n=1 Tax=Kuraishia capsulata CBS 1993 TaxID=1382522 RepID=W6MWF9_9ASCO|nr:uncharacterized protein KUCA_T00003353001 [Kuraishia capsulata CBS 1993]CDK27375.1 unnamed protein product [Kuraishia capsulata CBS 1993]
MAMDFSDFESFLGDDFNALEFANDLILSTNNIDDTSIDLATPAKRLGYDLKEADKRIKQTASDNYPELIQSITRLDKVKSTIGTVKPSLDHLNVSYARLDNDVVKPYEEAMTLHTALKRIHATSTLLRSVTYFIYLVQQVEEHFKMELLTEIPYIHLLKCCKSQYDLRQHLVESPSLKSLKLVRDYDDVVQERQQRVIDISQTSIRKFNAETPDNVMINSLLSLAISSPEALYNAFQQLVSNQALTSLNILTRTLTSPRSFENAMKDVAQKGRLISKVSKVMSNIRWPLSDRDEDTSTKHVSMLNQLSNVLELQDLLSSFWKDVATAFEPKFKDTMQRGGPVAKSLRAYSDSIKLSIRECVTNSSYGEPLREDGIEVRMMLNSVNSLDTIRR